MRSDEDEFGNLGLGPMATRFVPGGYQPQWIDESMVAKVRRAVEGLGDLMDGYEFHYPGELSPDNLDAVRGALDGHDIYCVASGMHLDPLFGEGRALLARRQGARRGDPAHARRGRLRAEVGAHFIIWPGIEGYNYPFQTPYKESWARFIDGVGQAARRARRSGASRSSSSTRTPSPR